MAFPYFRIVLDPRGFICDIDDPSNLLGYGADTKNLIGHNWFSKCLGRSDIEELKTFFHEIVNRHEYIFDHYQKDVLHKNGQRIAVNFRNRIIKINQRNYIESFGSKYIGNSNRHFKLPKPTSKLPSIIR